MEFFEESLSPVIPEWISNCICKNWYCENLFTGLAVERENLFIL